MEAIGEFFKGLFENPIVDLTPFEFAMYVLLCIAAFFIIKWILKIVWAGIKFIFGGIYNNISAKKKCQKIQCPHCGRTLDKCVCEDNKKRGYLGRLHHYKKEQKSLKKVVEKK